MAEEDPAPLPLESDRAGQRRKAGALAIGGPPVGVGIGELSEVIVARVGVPAAAIGAALREGLVVISSDRADLELVQDRIDLPGIRTEAAEIAEAEDSRCTARARVLRRRAER